MKAPSIDTEHLCYWWPTYAVIGIIGVLLVFLMWVVRQPTLYVTPLPNHTVDCSSPVPEDVCPGVGSGE